MEIAQLQARPRGQIGTCACRGLRRQNLVPAVLYGRGGENVLLTLDRVQIERLVREHTFIVHVGWDSQADDAQIKEIQYDALGDRIVHVDLMRISLLETIEVSVPVVVHGQARGVTLGGVMEIVRHELDIRCLPTNVPNEIRVEVAELDIDENVTVGQLDVPEGVTIVADPDEVVVAVHPPVEIEEPTEEAEEAGTEPEVIGREAEKEEEAGEEESD